jgi:hypothetical protein
MRVLWSAEAAPSLQGLAMAREGGRILAWDCRRGLFLFDARGHLIQNRSAPAEMMTACCAADGASFAAIGVAGQVWLLDQQLLPRWERAIPQGAAVALDSFGDRVAAADAAGGLHLFDGQGQPLWRSKCPRPLRFLTFVPEVSVLLGCADFGLVLCCDALGRCIWRDAPVTHTGSLAASGNGSVVAQAGYSDGLCCYGVRQARPQALRGTAPCRLADVAYDGRTFLTAGLDDRIALRDENGSIVATETLPARPVALALAPAGDRAAVALMNGTIQMLTTRES